MENPLKILNYQQNHQEKSIKEQNIKNKRKINEYINKEEIFSLDTNNTTKYDSSYINEIKDIPESIKTYYQITSDNIKDDNDTKKEYLSKLKNYFNEINKKYKEN